MSESPGTPSRSTSIERVRRNREIAEARVAGETWDAIAARFGLSERHARRAEREHLAGVDELSLDEDPAAVLREAIGVHRWALDRFASLAERGDNSSARLGAIRSRVATSRDLVELLARAGLVPPTPYAWPLAIDVRRVGEAMIEVADRHGILLDEVVEEMDRVSDRWDIVLREEIARHPSIAGQLGRW